MYGTSRFPSTARTARPKMYVRLCVWTPSGVRHTLAITSSARSGTPEEEEDLFRLRMVCALMGLCNIFDYRLYDVALLRPSDGQSIPPSMYSSLHDHQVQLVVSPAARKIGSRILVQQQFQRHRDAFALFCQYGCVLKTTFSEEGVEVLFANQGAALSAARHVRGAVLVEDWEDMEAVD